jgi:thiamine-monophosphate kinase
VQVPANLRSLKLRPLDLALHGGEDYELLFTVPKKFSARLPREIAKVPVTVIGEITAEKKVLLIGNDSKAQPLRPFGWDPFRK